MTSQVRGGGRKGNPPIVDPVSRRGVVFDAGRPALAAAKEDERSQVDFQKGNGSECWLVAIGAHVCVRAWVLDFVPP